MIASWARSSAAPLVRADVGDLPSQTVLPWLSTSAERTAGQTRKGAREIARGALAGRCVITTVILPEKARKKMLAKGINAESYAARIRKQNMPLGCRRRACAVARCSRI